ncbi:MAG: hypothetical protein V1718_03845 [archaeon]
MNHSMKTGFSFGLTSAIITTLGLMVGLHAGTNSRTAILGGIPTIAIADAFSDSLGIHISEESECKHTSKEIWQSTITTFASKFLFALTFIIPLLITSELNTAIIISIIWGLSALSFLSFRIAKAQKTDPAKVIGEHLLIALTVIVLTHYAGDWISKIII